MGIRKFIIRTFGICEFFRDVNSFTKQPAWGGESSLSEVTSVQLEFRDISRIINNSTYEDLTFATSKHIHNIGCKHYDGLCGMFVNPKTGQFRGKLESCYFSGYQLRDDYNKSMNAMERHLVRQSEPNKLTFVGEILPGGSYSPKMVKLYLLFERFVVRVFSWCSIPFAPLDAHCLLRPEAIEAWFYLYRATGDKIYQEWGWKAFKALEKHAKVEYGYSSVVNVKRIPVSYRDMMESFFLSETLKYLYLLLADDQSEIPLDRFVFNTEGHPLPIYDH
uniref:alpha-1,2-Mannosidase n=1 Tax=Parascaris equorum TaxID=6256 RepID=A0A914RLQ1_PAREQ